MQYDCMPSCKCEPLHIRPFIRFYNSTSNTNYVLKECLDVKDRSSKQPEALYVDKNYEKPRLVVERKAIVWPKDAQKYHSAFHEHCDWFSGKVRPHFQNACYLLLLNGTIKDSKLMRQKHIEKMAELAIQNEESIKKGKGISGTVPVKWSFGRVNPVDWDMPANYTGVGVNWFRNDIFEELAQEGLEQFYAEIKEIIQDSIDSANSKFSEHGDCIKILLFEEYVDDLYLGADDVKSIVEDIKIDNIDSVWYAEKEYNDSEYDWKFSRVYSRLDVG